MGEAVTEASITFESLRNWDNNPNDLWITLIDTATVGTTVYTDNQALPNYFGAAGLEIHHYEDLSSSSLTRTYTFDAAERVALNNYIADNNFGIGIDPDCHFYNCGIELKLVAEPGGGEIPEPVAGSILLGGLGVLAARRKRS